MRTTWPRQLDLQNMLTNQAVIFSVAPTMATAALGPRVATNSPIPYTKYRHDALVLLCHKLKNGIF